MRGDEAGVSPKAGAYWSGIRSHDPVVFREYNVLRRMLPFGSM